MWGSSVSLISGRVLVQFHDLEKLTIVSKDAQERSSVCKWRLVAIGKKKDGKWSCTVLEDRFVSKVNKTHFKHCPHVCLSGRLAGRQTAPKNSRQTLGQG